MLFLILTACLLAVTYAGCPMRPTVEQTSTSRTPGDGGYRILISGQNNGYIPNAIHTINLQGCIYLKDCIKKLVRYRRQVKDFDKCKKYKKIVNCRFYN